MISRVLFQLFHNLPSLVFIQSQHSRATSGVSVYSLKILNRVMLAFWDILWPRIVATVSAPRAILARIARKFLHAKAEWVRKMSLPSFAGGF
jgi:hypothetical protein